MQEAMHYEANQHGVTCVLCPKHCVIAEGGTGFCEVRQNVGNTLYAKNYGLCTACALDPIEKKPLYHFYPGSSIFSLGTFGCNFACRFCQNWQIAKSQPVAQPITPCKAVLTAKDSNSIGLAYTYSEPAVWYEFVLETAKLAQAEGLQNVLVTNGFISPAPLAELLPYLAALNIDVKAFREDFYHEICRGSLSDVKASVKAAARACHVEVTTLLIPGLNDDISEIISLAQWLSNINPDIPLHLTRYFPNYQLNIPPTPLSVLMTAQSAAREYLHFVYIGNVQGAGTNTYCPQCRQLLIDRTAWISYATPDNTCPVCGKKIPLVGKPLF